MTKALKARCHCGAIEMNVTLSDGMNTIRRCDCSFCMRRGAPAVTALIDGIQIVKGEDALTLYTWNTGTAKHYFCKHCGIYTHHQRRSNPNEFGVNAANIEGVYIPDYEPIGWFDGQNHPSDET